MIVYFGLGSNLGDRSENLREARERIASLGLKITRASSLYETEPVGFRDQGWFLNQVIEVDTADVRFANVAAEIDSDARELLEASALLDALLEIEREMGRQRTFTDGPRVIDIDLLLYGDRVFHQAVGKTHLIVPHPRMHLRRFVLEPLCEIAPGIIHPTMNKTCRQLLDELDDHSIVRLFVQSER
ncbi:MAG TPA: 2-amino-4-hydroxy-6-hydroxymethyldihydropteridine diphosphokinase [Blastocatellia bacterium]|jgi:2-amino-4-hydroxy-6-hydroxymethyldihydropteridine diphosphokinase